MVFCKEQEYQAVIEEANKHGVKPVSQGDRCPWFQAGQCQVYEARPFICRVFGHKEELKCNRGYNANAPGVVSRMEKEYAFVPERCLHEVIPEWREILGIPKELDKRCAPAPINT